MRSVLTFLITMCLAAGAFAQAGKTVTAPAPAAVNGQQFGAWTLTCVAEGVGKTNCALIQRLITREPQALVAEVGLNREVVDGAERFLMIMVTPEGMALNLAPVFAVDGAEAQTSLIWRTCASGRCRAAKLLEDEEAAALRAGARMVMAYQPFGAAEPVRFPVSLEGVAAGLTALGAE